MDSKDMLLARLRYILGLDEPAAGLDKGAPRWLHGRPEPSPPRRPVRDPPGGQRSPRLGIARPIQGARRCALVVPAQ